MDAMREMLWTPVRDWFLARALRARMAQQGFLTEAENAALFGILDRAAERAWNAETAVLRCW